MSNRNTTVSLTLQIKGQQASQEMKRISDQQVTATTKINQQWTQIGNAHAKFVNTAKAGTRETINTARAGDQLLRTNRMLEGVLRQQSIQTKLQSQLYKQNVTSAQQLANWTKQIEQSSKRTQQHVQQTAKSMGLLQKGSAVVGGAVVGGTVISSAMQAPRDYAKMLTYITSTATGGQNMNLQQRGAAEDRLNQYIKNAVRNGGGTRDDAAAAANALIASGKYDLNTVEKPLNAAVKTAFAADASAIDAAKLTVSMQDFGVTDLQKGHDIAVKGSHLGSFEYKDQAKWLNQQMAAAKVAGYSGEKGFVELVAMNQIAMKTAATTDEGGNNLVNLLAKLSADDLSTRVAKAVENTDGLPTKPIKNKKGKIVGREFDWNTYSIKERENGVYGVDAFVKLLEHQLSGNDEYQKLKKRMSNTTNSEEKKSLLEDMSRLAEGGELGKMLADRQALMAALAIYYNQNELNKIKTELPNAGGTVNAEYEYVSSRPWAKEQAADQEKIFAQSKAYEAVAGPLASFKTAIADIAEKHEGLAAATYGATVALTALAAAGGTAVILTGGKGGLGSGKSNGVKPVIAGRDPITNLPKKTKVSAGGALGLVGGAYVGSQLIKPYDDAGYNFISGLLAKIGIGSGGESPDFVKQAIENNKQQQALQQEQIQQNERMINEQINLSNKISQLIDVTGQNKPLPMSLSLLDGISQHATQQGKSHGAPPAYMIIK